MTSLLNRRSMPLVKSPFKPLFINWVLNVWDLIECSRKSSVISFKNREYGCVTIREGINPTVRLSPKATNVIVLGIQWVNLLAKVMKKCSISPLELISRQTRSHILYFFCEYHRNTVNRYRLKGKTHLRWDAFPMEPSLM